MLNILNESMELLKIKEAARILSVTAKTIYALHKKGALAFVKVGKGTRIERAELARFIEANKDTAKA